MFEHDAEAGDFKIRFRQVLLPTSAGIVDLTDIKDPWEIRFIVDEQTRLPHRAIATVSGGEHVTSMLDTPLGYKGTLTFEGSRVNVVVCSVEANALTGARVTYDYLSSPMPAEGSSP